jgi:hypothetical protein
MALITKQCAVSGQEFVITDEDQAFYKKMGVPLPTLCPEERRLRRSSIRNDLYLYNRKCDKTGKSIISMYAPGAPYVIYETNEWWSDRWNGLDYGRDFDFSRPFFEQFAELQAVVPRMGLTNRGENSEFNNYSLDNKDCYLVHTADHNEKCYYLRYSDRNYQCMDSDFTYDSRFCIGLMHAENCETCFFSQKIKGSSNLYFCYNMQNCHDCMFSTNLQNQQYMIFNKKMKTREEYEIMKKNMGLDTQAGFKKAKKYFEEHLAKTPRKHLELKNCEDCAGDYLIDCKDVVESYDCYRCRDIKFGTYLHEVEDCYDWDFVGYKSELCYEISSSAYNLHNCKFTMNCWTGGDNLNYCELCLSNKDLFGCIGLRKKQYCILNKQYTKEEYEELVPRIIEHMKKTGEWGEFFPVSISPYGYNETVAYESFPLTKEEALARGYKWKDKDDSAAYQGPEVVLPENVIDADESVCDRVLQCSGSTEFYKIIPQELKLYKKFKIALPRLAPTERRKKRMTLRNPRQLWDRACDKCSVTVKTSYAPERPEPIYCEACYLKEVF